MGTDPEARNCALIFLVGEEFDIIFLTKFGFKNGISSKDGMPIHVTDFPEPLSDIIMLKFMFRLRLKKSYVVHRWRMAIHLRAISQQILMNLIRSMCSEIVLLKLLPHMARANDLSVRGILDNMQIHKKAG